MRVLIGLVAATLASAPVGAATFLFTLDGSGFSGSGTITTDGSTTGTNRWACGACAAGTGYLVTDVSGAINGQALSVIPQGALSGNSNFLYLAGPYLDLDGLGFKIGAANYDLFDGNNRGRNSYYLIGGADGMWDNPVTFSITPQENQLDVSGVPDSASWMMMMAGFGAIGATLRRRRQYSLA